MSVRWISVLDLLEFKESRDIVYRGNISELEQLLYSCGFDVYTWGIAYQICNHRPLCWSKNGNNRTAYTMRFLSLERNDPEWINSGNMSEEKKQEVMYLNDPEFQEELARMSVFPNPTLDIMNKLEEHWGWLKEEEVEDD